MLIGGAVICLLLVGPLKLIAAQPRATRLIAAFGLAFSLFGLTFSLFAPQALIAGIVGGLLLGGGLVILFVEWSLRFPVMSAGDGNGLLVGNTLTLLAASLLWAVFIFFDNPLISSVGAFALAIISGLPLLLPDKSTAEKAPPNNVFHSAAVAANAASTGATANAVAKNHSTVPQVASNAVMPLKQIVAQSWGAIFGLAFNLFTLGLTFRPDSAGMGAASFSFKPVAYLVILAILLIITVLRPQSTGGDAASALLCRILLPVGSAIMLASPFMEGLIPLNVLPGLSSLPYVGVGLLYLVGLNTIATLVRLDRTRALPLIASTILFCCAGMAAGIVVFSLLGKNAQIFSLCLLSLFFVALVITALYETGDRRSEAATDAITAENRFAENCQTFAQRFDLSPRETEILIYLARGRGSIWIGKQLNISPETVRTHCKRIYDKTDVHNKEDLIDAVEHSV
jgi:DNA-binding CsgD family transcriptional regulator